MTRLQCDLQLSKRKSHCFFGFLHCQTYLHDQAYMQGQAEKGTHLLSSLIAARPAQICRQRLCLRLPCQCTCCPAMWCLPC